MRLVDGCAGSAFTCSTCPPDSVSIRMPPALLPWLVKPAPTRSMYQGTFCIESTAPWMDTKPPPSRTNCWRLANSIAVSACAPRPTVESKITVLYSRSVSM